MGIPRHTLRNLGFLFAANTISGFSQGITMLAIPWYLLQQPDGKFRNAAMVATITLLTLFWGMYAGTLIDRYNRKHIFLLMNGVDGVILLSVAALGAWLGTVPFALIVLVFTVTVFTHNVHFPNLYAFVQELFEPKYYARVNSAIEIQGQTTSFLGMMVAGLLFGGTTELSWWPEAWQFEPWPLWQIIMLDGCTYLTAMFFLALVRYQPSVKKRIDRGSVMVRIQQGFDYLWARPMILVFGIASYVIFFAMLTMMQVGAPVYVNDYLQEPATSLSSFKGGYALGAITAGILGMLAMVRRGNSIYQIIGLLLITGCIYVMLSTTQSVYMLIGGAWVLGITNAGARILRITYLVKIIPNYVIGRVNSFFNVVNVSMRVCFIGLLATPFFADPENGGHIVYALMIFSGIMFSSAAVLWYFYPRIPKPPSLSEESSDPSPTTPPPVAPKPVVVS